MGFEEISRGESGEMEVSISGSGGARLLEIAKELPARHDPDSVDETPFLPPVEQRPLRLRVGSIDSKL